MEEINKLNEFHIILRDFSVNIIEENHRIPIVLSSYTQFLRKPTHISCSYIHHIYIQNEFLEYVNVTSQFVGVHFSNYDAMGICFVNILCEQFFLIFTYCLCFSFVLFFVFLIIFKQCSLTLSIFL